MARSEQDKERFLKLLEEAPFITYACKKTGISRASIYRYMDSNYRFKQKVHAALKVGRENMSDTIESVLVKKAKEGEMPAIKFFLTHNSKRYSSSAKPLEDGVQKEKTLEDHLRGRDGKIRVQKNTAIILDKMYREEEEPRRRALGLDPLPPPDYG